MHKFQRRVDKISGTSKIVFTTELWKPNEDNQKTKKVDNRLSVVQTTTLPYLDMCFYWNCRGELRFKVHMKPNQRLKYLNKGSCHMYHCFTAIPWGVFGRLSRLTSKTKRNLGKSIDELYLYHAKALEDAKLFSAPFPSLQKIINNTKKHDEKKEEEIQKPPNLLLYRS